MGVPTPEEQLHSGCKLTASQCHADPAYLDEMLQKGSTGVRVEPETVSTADGQTDVYDYTWGHFEDHDQCNERMAGVVGALSKHNPKDSVLCISHGGPTGGLYEHLVGGAKPSVGMTSVFIYVNEDGKWSAPVVANQDHLEGLAGATCGPNDASEQKKKSNKREATEEEEQLKKKQK